MALSPYKVDSAMKKLSLFFIISMLTACGSNTPLPQQQEAVSDGNARLYLSYAPFNISKGKTLKEKSLAVAGLLLVGVSPQSTYSYHLFLQQDDVLMPLGEFKHYDSNYDTRFIELPVGKHTLLLAGADKLRFNGIGGYIGSLDIEVAAGEQRNIVLGQQGTSKSGLDYIPGLREVELGDDDKSFCKSQFGDKNAVKKVKKRSDNEYFVIACSAHFQAARAQNDNEYLRKVNAMEADILPKINGERHYRNLAPVTLE
jgi:hypothetical protein